MARLPLLRHPPESRKARDCRGTMKSPEFWDWYESFAAPRLKGETPFHNRANTFRAMMKYLDNFANPVIVETGCIEGVGNNHWAGNGCSTIIFDKYVSHNGGKVYSVEI